MKSNKKKKYDRFKFLKKFLSWLAKGTEELRKEDKNTCFT